MINAGKSKPSFCRKDSFVVFNLLEHEGYKFIKLLIKIHKKGSLNVLLNLIIRNGIIYSPNIITPIFDTDIIKYPTFIQIIKDVNLEIV